MRYDLQLLLMNGNFNQLGLTVCKLFIIFFLGFIILKEILGRPKLPKYQFFLGATGIGPPQSWMSHSPAQKSRLNRSNTMESLKTSIKHSFRCFSPNDGAYRNPNPFN